MFTVLIENKDENTAAFMRYIPIEIRSELEKPETIAIGITDADGVAAGALVARVVSDWVEIMWLFIGKEFRNNGYGTALLRELMSGLKYSPNIYGVFGQFPGKNSGDYERFFSRVGFGFEEQDIASYAVTLAELESNPFWKKEPTGTDKVALLNKVADVSLRQLEVKLGLSETAIALDFPVSWRDYDKGLSAAYVKGGKVAGILLIEKNGLDIDLSYAYVEAGEGVALPAMLYKSGKTAVDTMPPETIVLLNAITDVSVRLVEKLFPNLAAISSKFAVCRKEDFNSAINESYSDRLDSMSIEDLYPNYNEEVLYYAEA